MTNENEGNKKEVKVIKLLLGGSTNGQPIIFAEHGGEYDAAVDAYQIYLFLNCQIPAITTNMVKKLLNRDGSLKEILEIQERLKQRENPELYAMIKERKEAIERRKAAKKQKEEGATPSSAKEVE